MTDTFNIKEVTPAVLIGAALGAGAALFMGRPNKSTLKYGLIGAGAGLFASALGMKFGREGQSLTGATAIERSAMMRPLAAASRMGGFRARGDFSVGDWGDYAYYDPYAYLQPACPDGFALDAWGNCVQLFTPPFSLEQEILYLYPEIVLQYPDLRLHPDWLFRYRPELRTRYAGIHSAADLRARYQQVHHQPPPARPKDAPPIAPRAPQGGAQDAARKQLGGGGQAAAAQPPSAQRAPAPAPVATPHAVAPPPQAAMPAAPVAPPGPPVSAAPSQPPIAAPTAPAAPVAHAHGGGHAASGWYTPGWRQHFPPTAYEYNHYGPMEYWWTT